MPIELPALPYALNALEPYITKETLEYHYGKHHKTYIDNLNMLIKNTDLGFDDKEGLEGIVKNSSDNIFNNAAQAYNHNFYWNCLKPNNTNLPTQPKNSNKSTSSVFLLHLEKNFGNLQEFKKQFTDKAFGIFGSGWAWLVKHKYTQKLEIITTANADTPLTNNNLQPLLTCDVWEHAYYIDYRNARAKYLDAFWHLVNWEFLESNFHNAV